MPTQVILANDRCHGCQRFRVLSENKEPRRIRLNEINDYSGGSLRGFIADVVEPGALVITDGWSGYHTLPGNPHESAAARRTRSWSGPIG